MKKQILIGSVTLSVLVALGFAAEDKYSVKVPDGLAFSEFRGYEDWQVVAPSHTDASNVMRVILANPVMMKAYREGIPANGKRFPDGSKMAKIEWEPRKITEAPFSVKAPDTVPGPLTEVEFVEKNSTRFADTHGWGYGAFKYDAASDAFTPVTLADKSPAGERCQVRGHVPYPGGEKGLHFHGIPAEIKEPSQRPIQQGVKVCFESHHQFAPDGEFCCPVRSGPAQLRHRHAEAYQSGGWQHEPKRSRDAIVESVPGQCSGRKADTR